MFVAVFSVDDVDYVVVIDVVVVIVDDIVVSGLV